MVSLTRIQRKIIELLSQNPLKEKFYWTGGTLLSHYYLHHRFSLDLDFFSEKPFSYEELVPFLKRVKEKLRNSKIQEHKIDSRWDFIIINQETVRVEFVFYNHEKKRLKPLKSYLGIHVDSLEDIAANKTMAYFDRNEPKDLFDLYFLMTKQSFQAKDLLHSVESKFGASFPELMFWSESAKSLKLLDSLRPLMIEKNEEKQKKLIKKISDFFLKKGSLLLKKQLEK